MAKLLQLYRLSHRRRRSFVTFLLLAFVFLFMSAFGSYRAFEHTESVQFCGQTCHTVMKPEFTAYQAGAHARVKCVDCHNRPTHVYLTPDQSVNDSPSADGTFRHPVALGTQGEFHCAECHKGNRGFQHPLDLGDISQFQCTDCHAGKLWGITH